MQPRVADTVKPQLPDVVTERPKLGPAYHSPLTMIGWCILLHNFAGVVPVMLVSAYITYGFFIKRDLASAVALNLLTSLLLLHLRQQGIPHWIDVNASMAVVLLPVLLILMVSCTTEVLRLRSGQVALWMRAITLLACTSGLFGS